MGVLSAALLGGAQGFGTGLAQVGGSLMQEALIEARERERLAREEAILNRRAELTSAGVLGVPRGTSGSRSAAARGVQTPPLDPFNPVDRATAAFHGATPREHLDVAAQLAQGNRPMGPATQIVDDEYGPQTIQGPQYTQGQEQVMRENAARAFFTATLGRDPGHADDLAKGYATMQGARMAQDYARSGDLRSAEGALITQGKGVMDATGSSVITGRAAPGSEAEAKIGLLGAQVTTEGARQKLLGAQVGTEHAQAGKYGAEAGEARAKTKGAEAEVKDKDVNQAIRVVDQARSKYTPEISRIMQSPEFQMARNQDERDALLAPIEARIQSDPEYKAAVANRDRMMALARKAPEPAQPTGSKAPAAKQPDMARANTIKAELRAGRITREQALAQLRAIGFQ